MPENLRQCLLPAIECIKKNTQDNVVDVRLFNENRHMMLTTYKGLKYWMLFKRDFFNSFGKIFGLKGVGESINKEWVQTAIDEGIDAFMFVYEKGYVYIVPPKEFKDFAEKSKTIRVTTSGEITYSVPVKLLRRWR